MKQLSIIVVSGLPGAGKSTLAEQIAKRLQLPIFSVDPIESAMIKAGITKSFETGLAAYAVAETLAKEHLKLKQSVIIDAVCGVEQAKQMWRDVSQQYDAKLYIIECSYSDPALHRQRIEARVRGLHGLPEVTWERVESCRSEYTKWQEPKLAIDSADDLDANVDKAIKYLTLA